MQDADYQLFTESMDDELRFGNAQVPNLTIKIDNTLETLNLDFLRKRHPLSLSGGQKQRVTIAAAAVSIAPIVIFDEPTSGLDGKRKSAAQSGSLPRRGKTVLVISHDTEFLCGTCDFFWIWKKKHKSAVLRNSGVLLSFHPRNH